MRGFVEFVDEKVKKKVVLVVGSARSPHCCPNEKSKTHKLADAIRKEFSKEVIFEVVDLSVKCDGVVVQPCKGCTSTSSLHCHWPCIESSQRVHILDGFKEIKDIKIGDILQDGNKVINHLLTSEDEEIFQLKLTDGRAIKLTSNHKVKTVSKERYRDKSSGFKHYRKEEWKELKDISVGDNIPSMDVDDILEESKDEEDYLYTIYGLLWGDGTMCNNTAILYVDEKEKEFLAAIGRLFPQDIVSILPHKVTNGKIRPGKKEATRMVKINFGTRIGKKFKELFPKTSAKDRRLDVGAFKNKTQVFNFLNGWISTDGSVGKGLNIYNTSYDLLRDLQLLLSRVRIKSSLYDLRHMRTEIKGKEYQRCSRVSIKDQDSLGKLRENLVLVHGNKQKKLEGMGQKRKMKHHFSKVKSIESIGRGNVYDIEVENSHFFNCEGIKVHNCDCYSKKSDPKDLMHHEDVYRKLEESDGFFVITPINWSACSSVVKSFFDRLVCASLSITTEQAESLMDGEIKNASKTRAMEKSGKYQTLLKNHLEGKVAGFFAHGNEGGSDYKEFAKNKKVLLPVIPASLEEYEEKHGKEDVSKLLDPLVRQCVYSGIFVPDDCVKVVTYGFGISYGEANDLFEKEDKLIKEASGVFTSFLRRLGTV
jgi:intein/homing endonuclease/NAD(P)H-dependent FMN reductase